MASGRRSPESAGSQQQRPGQMTLGSNLPPFGREPDTEARHDDLRRAERSLSTLQTTGWSCLGWPADCLRKSKSELTEAGTVAERNDPIHKRRNGRASNPLMTSARDGPAHCSAAFVLAQGTGKQNPFRGRYPWSSVSGYLSTGRTSSESSESAPLSVFRLSSASSWIARSNSMNRWQSGQPA
jgi:hypothetical protein